LDRRQIQIAKPPAEGDQLIIAEMQAAKQQDQVIEPSTMDRRGGAFVDVTQIDAAHFGAQGAARWNDLDALSRRGIRSRVNAHD
jgi:hypothetical protein